MGRTRSGATRVVLGTLLAGLAAGVIGGLLSQLNILIETLTLGVHFSVTTTGVGTVPLWRRLAAPVLGGLVSGLAWSWLRRRRVVTVADALDRTDPRRLSLHDQVVDAGAQLLVVGSGTSLGRETAPRQIAAVAGQRVAELLDADVELRRTLIAAASGAGLAAVYNVPAAGALYALELTVRPDLRRRSGWVQVGVAAVVSVLATVVAWLVNHDEPTYRLPPVDAGGWGLWGATAAVALACLAVGPGVALTFGRLKKSSSAPRRLWWTVPLGSAVVTLIALVVPQVPGNGQVVVNALVAMPLSWQLVTTLGVAKLVATCCALRSGAAGGLLTPSLAVGGSLGALVGIGLGTRSPAELVVLVVAGAACLLSMTQRAPLFSAAFALELTRPAAPVWLLVAAAVALTWAGWTLLSHESVRRGGVGRAPRRH